MACGRAAVKGAATAQQYHCDGFCYSSLTAGYYAMLPLLLPLLEQRQWWLQSVCSGMQQGSSISSWRNEDGRIVMAASSGVAVTATALLFSECFSFGPRPDDGLLCDVRQLRMICHWEEMCG